MGIILTSLRGATTPVVEQYVPAIGGHSTVREWTVNRATDDFLIWLEEKRVDQP